MTLRLLSLSFIIAVLTTKPTLTADEAIESACPRIPTAEIRAGGRPVGSLWSRSPVYAANGMAATAQPLATQIPLVILKADGSAVDAAIAANAALGLIEPTANGIRGDLFTIVWDPKTRRLHGLNASGCSPRSRSLAQLLARLDCSNTTAPLGHLPVTVPGAVDGWFELHERIGRLPMQRVLAPAIAYAREGFPVSPVIAYYFTRAEKSYRDRAAQIQEFADAEATYFSPNAPKAGEIFHNPDLASTYQAIAEGGREAFYQGKLAEVMGAYMKRIGGDLTLADFQTHRRDWVTPACVPYRSLDLCQLPPNSQGYAALQMANILYNVGLNQWPRGDARVLHYLTESKRLAYEDVAKYYADPDFAEIPEDWLLSPTYGKERFDLIQPDRAIANPMPGD